MKSRHILLYNNGEAAPAVMGEAGGYECWFARVLGPDVGLEVHRGFDEPRRSILGYDGLILSGSPRSLVEPEPWMDHAADFVRRVAHFGLPVLGVCFGHQLIGYAFGGKVRKNPRGWEAGTTHVWLTDAGRRDPLFHDVFDDEGRLEVNESHRDEIGQMGPALTLLARNERTAVQAIAIGDHVRGVQFHPEMDGAVIRRLLRHRQAVLDEDARVAGRPDRDGAYLLAHATDTPMAQRVLDNWLRHFVWHA